jgi:hypothetical protein
METTGACLSNYAPEGSRSDFFYRWTVFVRILPMLDQVAYYDQLRPQDSIFSSENMKHRATILSCYLCPSDGYSARTGWDLNAPSGRFALGNCSYASSVDGYHNADPEVVHRCTFDSHSGLLLCPCDRTPVKRPYAAARGAGFQPAGVFAGFQSAAVLPGWKPALHRHLWR